MRSVTFQSVLNGIAIEMGLDPSRDLNPYRASAITEYINRRVKEGWKFEFWPEWTAVEQRYYRAAYDATANVAAADERFFVSSGFYYQALRAQTPATQAPATLVNGVWVENSAYWAVSAQSYAAPLWTTGTVFVVGQQTQNPSNGRFYQCYTAHTAGATFDATKFGVLTAFNKYIAYDQTGQTSIGEVKRVCRRNPQVFPDRPGQLEMRVSNNGVQVEVHAPNIVWVEFRLRPPVFSSTKWSATEANVTGDIRFRTTTGECYTALQNSANQDPATATAYWQKIDFPEVLETFVKHAALADTLTDQKQQSRKVAELDEAYEQLGITWDQVLASQGQFETAAVETYGTIGK